MKSDHRFDRHRSGPAGPCEQSLRTGVTDSAQRRSPSAAAAIRGLMLIAIVAAVAATSSAAMHWDVVWGAVPGRVGPPTATIAVDVTHDHGAPDTRFAVLGDVGTGDANELAVAALVGRAATPIDALVLLGDNVYPNGDPNRLDATVFDPFADVLEGETALLPVLGNHDVADGHAAGQIKAFGMPGRWYATEIGPVLFIGLDSNLVEDPEQLRWLQATLDGNKTEWTIVAMHHPPYSAGYHGSTDDIQEVWVPVFDRYDVDLVLAGHDHDYQRTIPIDGVTYIVSGGGSKVRPTGRADFTAYAASVRHFLDVAIWDDRIEVTAISAEGPFDHFIIDAPRRSTGPDRP